MARVQLRNDDSDLLDTETSGQLNMFCRLAATHRPKFSSVHLYRILLYTGFLIAILENRLQIH